MQLAHHHALGAVDDEGALRCHERDFAHVNFLFLGSLFLAQLKGDVQRRAISLAFSLRFQRAQLRLANVIMAEIEDRFFVVALNRENLPENRLQAIVPPFGERDIFLEEIDVGIELDFDQVRRLNAFFDGSEVNTFRHNH